MSASFVPTFTQWREREGDEAAWALGRQLMATLFVVLMALCALGWVFAPQLIHALAGGFGAVPGKLELTVTLTRIMLPFLPAVALAAAAMGMLNARGVFFLPALAPALLNLGMIAFGLALIPVCRALGVPIILAMAFGVVGGGVLQFACQLPALHTLGFLLRPEIPTWHPGVRRVATLMLPATVGLPAFAAVGVFTRAFYALGDTKTPVRATFIAVGVNLVLNLLFVGPLARLGLAHRGLALATSVTAFINLTQLAFGLRGRIGGID